MVCYYVTRVIRYADLCRSLQIDAHVRLRDADVTRALAAVYLVHITVLGIAAFILSALIQTVHGVL